MFVIVCDGCHQSILQLLVVKLEFFYFRILQM
jgi:hypothetical protein